MKNYLYILCAFLLAFAGCTKDADVEPIAPAPDGNTQVVLTGFSGRGTRTGFGGAEDGAVPFLWSAGDYIWARNTRSEAIAEGGSQATFVFESLETADTYDVFYNQTGPAAATALIPAEQTQQAAGELNLGQNGDFGYATAQNGTFTLEHATSYVWFDTYSSDVTSNLLSITLSVSGGQTIAGEAAFADGKLGDCKGSSSVTLSFGEEGVALPSQSNDTDVFAAMVLYPADLSTATVSIVYKFADGSVYLQTKSGKTLTPGHTLRLSTQIAKSDCKSSGAFFMTEAGVAEELPTEPIGYLKVVTLGESTLSAEELTSIAGNLANGAVIDLGEATLCTIIPSLAKVDLSMLPTIGFATVVIFVAVLVFTFIVFYVTPAWKIVGSKNLSVGIAMCQMIGYPGTELIANEITNAVAQTPEEREAVSAKIQTAYVISGFTSVTILSVFIASFLAKLL